jgi:hypothetical protein
MRALLALLAVTALSLTIACGGDDEPSGTVGPVGTKSGAPTATAEATSVDSGGPPAPPDPTLDEALTLITSGAITADIAPGETYPFDPQTIAQDAGSTASCDNFQFGFTWQVQSPYPPDGVVLQWQIERESAKVKVAEGPSGEQSIGCDAVEALNAGPDAITVAVKYKLGGLGP